MNKKKKKCEFEFCKVCRLNHDQGPRHKYFPRHKTSLSTLLARFLSKIGDVRASLRNPSVAGAQPTSPSGFWCVFCENQVDERGSSLACENAIQHLASVSHFKNLKHFMWKYGDGSESLDNFRILEVDLVKWEKKCKSLNSEAAASEGGHGVLNGPSNDIHNKFMFETLSSHEKSAVNSFTSSTSNAVMPLQYNTNEYQISPSGVSEVRKVGLDVYGAAFSLDSGTFCGTSLWNSNHLMDKGCSQHSLIQKNSISSDGGYQMNGGLHWDGSRTSSNIFGPGLQNVTQVLSSFNGEAGGNVHSGAPPPWLEATDEALLNTKVTSSSSSSISSVKGSSKSRKLNPKRVGAAWAEKRKMELEKEKAGEIIHSDYDANWLPNFGRVWQSGSRKESRKEFESEKLKPTKVETEYEVPMKMQPYISKRMRGEMDE